MQRSKPRNKKEISREKSLALIKETATRLFVEQGFNNCHVEGIARASGFTKGAVYHYFSSKDAILEAILEEIEVSIFESTEKATSLPGDNSTARLVAFLNGQASYAMRNPAQFSLLVFSSLNFANSEGVIGDKVRAIFERLQGELENLIEEGQERGEFTKTLGTVDFARVIVGCYVGNVVEWQRSGFVPEIGRSLVRGVRYMILSALVSD
ncbi:TetR/AcrR family transcriptional regulator [Hoeflea alexandrii]|uniref:TetR/AcrR family transcriptional regulator n=1 Tax=Hoeflea alexandrii TaxID=288436 RepID=UPI0022B054FC|nr:TetR/AcrR family transcriptional regulator [Hoeflea alexandrii]MCZ4291666.1 TetR/AcrR family transcriptional regulator [Hoeflea alexandrii]